MILGNTAASTTDDTQNANAKTVQSLTVPVPVTVVAALGAWRFTASGSQPMRVCLYTDSAGSPSARLGYSSDVTVSAGGALAEAYYTWPFATPVNLSASTVWYGYHGGAVTGTAPIMREIASGSFKYQNAALDTFSNGFPADPFGTISGTVGFSLCLYLVCADGRLIGLGAGA